MKSTTDTLLAIISLCLILITLKIYDINFVTKAYATSEETHVIDAGAHAVRLYGLYDWGNKTEWKPIAVDKGGLLRISATAK